MDTFGVDHTPVDGHTHGFRLTLRGELDQSTTETLRTAIDDLITDGARFIVLDLADVSFLDSTGLRAILAAAQTLRDRDGRLTCEGLSGAAGRVLELTGTLEGLRDARRDEPTT
jgi:anti-sigma B factor antagonist